MDSISGSTGERTGSTTSPRTSTRCWKRSGDVCNTTGGEEMGRERKNPSLIWTSHTDALPVSYTHLRAHETRRHL
eukprot:7280483-Prorocentrum_lima.AAC.1